MATGITAVVTNNDPLTVTASVTLSRYAQLYVRARP